MHVCLHRVVFNYNNVEHSSIGFTPSVNLLKKPNSQALVRETENNDDKKANWKPSHPFFQSFKVGDWVVRKGFPAHHCTKILKPR